MGKTYMICAAVLAFALMTACKNEKPVECGNALPAKTSATGNRLITEQIPPASLCEISVKLAEPETSSEIRKAEYPVSGETLIAETPSEFGNSKGVSKSAERISAETPSGLEDAILIAKVLYGECCWCSAEQQAAVVWTILNRVDAGSDAGFGDSIAEVVTAPLQFAFSPNAPVLDHLLEIAEDVLGRWVLEKDGVEDVGRILPGDYYWFSGDGVVNYFRNWYRGGTAYWDWSLLSPYEGRENTKIFSRL